jgi:GNAT superfamily N-acetyltransferase
MSHYKEYLLEKTNDKIMETEIGFATYRSLNDGKTIYIIDIYVVPEYRKTGVAGEMADLILAKEKPSGCVELLGTVIPSNKNSTASLSVLMAYGMKLHSASNDLIVFRKDV